MAWLNQNAGAIQAIFATLIFIVTTVYVIINYRMHREMVSSSKIQEAQTKASILLALENAKAQDATSATRPRGPKEAREIMMRNDKRNKDIKGLSEELSDFINPEGK